MFKKWFAVLLALVMVFSMAACQSGEDGTKSPTESQKETSGSDETKGTSDAGTDESTGETENPNVHPEYSGTITLSHWMNGGTMEKVSVNTVLEQFKKEYPNVEVKVNFISGDYSTKMYANLAAAKESDVFMVADGDFGKWAAAGVLENLQPYIDASANFNESDLWDSAVSRYKYDGEKVGQGDIYVIPKDISPRVLFYNRDMLKEFGVEEPDPTKVMSFDEFAELLKKIADPDEGIYGIGQLNWEGMVRSHGTNLISDDAKSSNLSDPKLIEAFQRVSDMIHVDQVMPTSAVLGSATALILFQSQRAAFYDGAIYDLPSIQSYGFDWGVCLLPGWEEDPYNSGWTGSVGYAVSKNSKNKELAYLVAEYFGSRTGQQILTSIGFNIPLYKDMAESDLFMNLVPGVDMTPFVIGAEHQQPCDRVYTMDDQWYEILGNRIQPLWNDPNQTAEKQLKNVKAEIDGLLKR